MGFALMPLSFVLRPVPLTSWAFDRKAGPTGTSSPKTIRCSFPTIEDITAWTSWRHRRKGGARGFQVGKLLTQLVFPRPRPNCIRGVAYI